MPKTAFIFPGQGSQYAGMGRELYDSSPEARSIFDKADSVFGSKLTDIMFAGSEEALRKTSITQPAIYTVSMAAFEMLKPKAGMPYLLAGHSLGEYSAFTAAGAFDFETGFLLVKRRGEIINEEASKRPGSMAAILGIDGEKLKHICTEISSAVGACEPVNFNAPGQIVIAGLSEAVEKAMDMAKSAGASKCIQLNVSGAFHSSLMKAASERMSSVLKETGISEAKIPVVANCDALETSQANEIINKLTMQIDHPVLWEESIKNMIKSGVDVFVEIGPGRVLSGLLRRIDRTKRTVAVENLEDAEKLLAGGILS